MATAAIDHSRIQNEPPAKGPIPLKLWAFNVLSDQFGIIVDGYRETDDTAQTLSNWTTTAIKKVTGHGKVIETVSGATYKLVGDVDRTLLKRNGFPDSLIQLFIHGFPLNWETILREYWEKRKNTNPLNANNWFDHKMAVEIKRKSMGVKLNDAKARQSRIGSTRAADKANSQLAGPIAAADMSPLSTQASQKDPVRRSPRINTASLNQSIMPATPNTAANITSNSMQAKKKLNDEPTPRFVPQTDGRSQRRRSAASANSTPIKGKPRQSVPDFIFPNVSAISSTPRARSVSQSPASKPIGKQNACLPQTPTTRSNSSTRITRSASVQREPTKAVVAVKSTPRRSVGRSPSVTAASKRATSMPSPAKMVATPQKGKTVTKKTEMLERRSEKVQTIDNAIIFDGYEGSEPTTTDHRGANQPEKISSRPSFDNFKAPLLTTREIAHGSRPPRAQSVPNRKTDSKATVLSQWHIKFMPEMAAKTGDLPPFIFIGNQINEEQPAEEAQLWHTTLIMRVTEGAIPDQWSFHTSRSEYKLSGKICIKEMVFLGFTQDFVRAFLTGFPTNWKELLWAAFNNTKQNASNPVGRLDITSNNDRSVDPGNNSSRLQREGSFAQPITLDVEEPSTFSSRGRSVRKTVSPSIPMPILNFERGGRQRVQPKKRTIEYSSSSSDNEAVIRTLRDVHYGDDIFNKHGPSRKKSRRAADSDGEGNIASDLLRKISQKKRKLQKQMDVLDEKMQEIVKQMEEKLVRQERVNKIKARDREDRDIIEMDNGRNRRGRKTETVLHRSQAVIYTSSSDSDLTTDDDSTETEVTDDGGEWKKTPKYRKQRARIMKKQSLKQKRKSAPKEKDINIFDDINNEYSDEDVIELPKKVKKRTWRQIDLDKLKHAINTIKVNSEEDWEQVSKTVGPDFSPADCKDMAIKKLHWKPPQVKEKRTDDALVITARQGTQAYGIQMNEQHRKYVLGAGSQGGDCFREQAPEDDDEMAMTNVADLDDSILAALRTPSIGELPRNKRGGPVIPAAFEDDEDTPRAGRKSLAAFEQNTAQREAHQRYLHQITNNRSFINLSRNNTLNMSKAGTSRAAENIGKKMDRIKKDVHANIRKKRDDSDFDEEDELLAD